MGTENIHGAPTGYQPPIITGRPIAGPADPETRRRLLAQQLAGREAMPAPAEQPAPGPSPTRDLSVLTAIQRLVGRRQSIDDTVNGRQ